MSQAEDRQNRADVQTVRQALEIAEEALRRAMEGGPPRDREEFAFQIGFARGRLTRVSERIDPGLDTPSYICPRCGAVSYNPIDIGERYCGRCHRFADHGS